MSAEDIRDAARQLIRTPLVLAGHDPEGHHRIRRNADALTALFRGYLGYRLVVDARMARLSKAGLGPNDGRPLLRSSRAPFSPRDYTYLALLCSVLLTGRTQVLLSSVVSDVRQAAAEVDIDLGADTLSERRALVHAVRQLIAWGIVTEDAGSVSEYAEDPSQEALLFVERELIRHLLSVPLREVEDAAELVRLSADPGPDAVRHTVRRRMVEAPVVMVDDTPEAERAWLRQNQRREAQALEDNFGLSLEIRAEGVAAFDRREELTDVAFPREGSLGQAALLTVSELVSRLAPTDAAAPVPDEVFRAVVQGLLARHGRRWSKDYTDHPERLGPDVEDMLVDVGLMARAEDGSLRLRAVAARYAPQPEVVETPPMLELDQSEEA